MTLSNGATITIADGATRTSRRFQRDDVYGGDTASATTDATAATSSLVKDPTAATVIATINDDSDVTTVSLSVMRRHRRREHLHKDTDEPADGAYGDAGTVQRSLSLMARLQEPRRFQQA
ncbi:hypothetical protein OK016_19315 [Vibrio chagasii]|nr:hypothetical protein [Vibrio chagasii]